MQKKINLKDMEIFDQVAMDFYFKEVDNAMYDTLIFAKKECIFSINFETEESKIIYELKESFEKQP